MIQTKYRPLTATHTHSWATTTHEDKQILDDDGCRGAWLLLLLLLLWDNDIALLTCKEDTQSAEPKGKAGNRPKGTKCEPCTVVGRLNCDVVIVQVTLYYVVKFVS